MTWLQTYTGRQFFPLNPRVQDFEIEDIAHSLSLQCRFNGHCLRFYSVAEHSVRVSDIVPRPLALWGLLHDAAEAYVADLPQPLKSTLPEYRAIEMAVLKVVAEHHDLPWPMPAEIKEGDVRLLVTEARDLMGPPPAPWGLSEAPLEEKIEPLDSAAAKDWFMERYRQLTGAAK